MRGKAFNSVLRLNGYPVQKAHDIITRLDQMSVDEFKAWQLKKKWEVVKFHHKHNTLYKELIGKHLPDNWNDLPIITKAHLQRPVSSIITEGIDVNNCYVASTSGSTGTPFHFAKDKLTHAITWSIIHNRYRWHGIEPSTKQARFFGMLKERVPSIKEQFKDMIMNRVRFPVFDLSDIRLGEFLQKFEKAKFEYIYGYTSSIVMFARYLINKNILLKDVCPSLKLCITTSETITPSDSELIRKAFGVDNIREYGLSETCITAFDDKHKDWLLTSESLFTEVVDGKVISTSLFNTAFPMLRYDTGDMGVIEYRNESKYDLLKDLTGRTNDSIILPSGKKAAGLTFYYVSRDVLEQSGVLKEFIVRQTRIDRFVLDVVAERDLTEEEVLLVKKKVSTYLEPGLDVVINRVDTIDRPASGKIKHFYSELS